MQIILLFCKQEDEKSPGESECQQPRLLLKPECPIEGQSGLPNEQARDLQVQLLQGNVSSKAARLFRLCLSIQYDYKDSVY